MPNQLRRLRSGLLRTAPSLFILALVQCGGEPLILLDIDPESLQNVTQLVLSLQLNDSLVQEQPFAGDQSHIAVRLPEGASGTVQIDLVGVNEVGCRVALANLQEEVPGGLSRSTRHAFKMQALTVPLCPQLRGVLPLDPTNVIVLGEHGTMFHCMGATCSVLPFGTTMKLNGAWKHDATTFYVVGDNATILRCSTSSRTCTVISTGPPYIDNLYRVWGNDAYVYAVGSNGLVMQCKVADTAVLSGCTKAPYSPKGDIYGLWGNQNSVYMASTNGTVMQCTSGPSGLSGCTSQNSGTRGLNHIWGRDTDNVVYVVGDGGTVLRCTDGSNTCTPLPLDPPNPMQNLNAVWGGDANNGVYAVGDEGTVLRCLGSLTSCSVMNSSTTKNLLAVSGNNDDNVYAVGNEGTVLRCASNLGCKTLTSGTNQQLLAVARSDDNNVYAVGEDAVVVKCAAVPNGCIVLNRGTTP